MTAVILGIVTAFPVLMAGLLVRDILILNIVSFMILLYTIALLRLDFFLAGFTMLVVGYAISLGAIRKSGSPPRITK